MPQDKRTYTSEAEVNAKLDRYRRDIAQGMSDTDLAKLTELPLRTIQRWRLKHGLKRPKGQNSKHVADIYALSVLGEGLADARQRTARSVLDGRWEPPLFVLREHLNYDAFLRVLDAAHRLLGMNEHELVTALGMSPKSIEQGLALYARQRADSSKTCPTCKDKMDPTRTDLFCSSICERLHAHSQ